MSNSFLSFSVASRRLGWHKVNDKMKSKAKRKFSGAIMELISLTCWGQKGLNTTQLLAKFGWFQKHEDNTRVVARFAKDIVKIKNRFLNYDECSVSYVFFFYLGYQTLHVNMLTLWEVYLMTSATNKPAYYGPGFCNNWKFSTHAVRDIKRTAHVGSELFTVNHQTDFFEPLICK